MINFFGPVNRLGIGVHCYNLAKAYEKMGNEVCLVPPFGSVGFKDKHVDYWLSRRAGFSPKDPSIMIFDTGFLTQFSGTPRIGFAVFETDRLSEVQLAAVQSCDFILTPSEWGKNALLEMGIKAFVVNEGFDPEEFPLVLNPRPENERFRFLSVGKFEERKGTAQIIRCFSRAMERKDAELVLHCDNPFVPEMGRREILQEAFKYGFALIRDGHLIREGLHIFLSSSTDAPITGLYQNADCGVFPTKGEGWGLPILECLASGTPAIAGAWTGQSEFLLKESPFTLKDSKMEIAVDHVWYTGDRGRWHVPSDIEIERKMRLAFDTARQFRRSAEGLRETEHYRGFTWDRAAGQLEEALEIISGPPR